MHKNEIGDHAFFFFPASTYLFFHISFLIALLAIFTTYRPSFRLFLYPTNCTFNGSGRGRGRRGGRGRGTMTGESSSPNEASSSSLGAKLVHIIHLPTIIRYTNHVQ